MHTRALIHVNRESGLLSRHARNALCLAHEALCRREFPFNHAGVPASVGGAVPFFPLGLFALPYRDV